MARAARPEEQGALWHCSAGPAGPREREREGLRLRNPESSELRREARGLGETLGASEPQAEDSGENEGSLSGRNLLEALRREREEPLRSSAGREKRESLCV